MEQEYTRRSYRHSRLLSKVATFLMAVRLAYHPHAILVEVAAKRQSSSPLRYINNSSNSDRIASFPGFNQPLPSPWRSGYLTYNLLNTTIHTHYIYVGAEDDDEKENKPIIYWSNGGPGASSMFGLLTEIGPLLLSDLSLVTEDYVNTGIPTPIYNPYSWSKLGSLLIFDAPAPVGFSYCNDDITGDNGFGCVSWTDELASLNAYYALLTFYKKYPLLRSKELYLTGESYAGIYIPTLARRILEGQQTRTLKTTHRGNDAEYQKEGNNGFEPDIKLRGFAVGDACLGKETSVCGSNWPGRFYWQLLFLAGHGQMPYTTFRMVMDACGEEALRQSRTDIFRDNKMCQDALARMRKQVGGFYVYSLYDDCTYRNGLSSETEIEFNKRFEWDSSSSLGGGLNDYPCGEGPVLEKYVNLQVVKKAFNVPLEAKFFNVDNAADFDYTTTEKDLTSFYVDIANGRYGNVRTLVYNGDTDPAITAFAAQNWTSHLGLEVNEEWRPWTVDNCRRVGGYVTRYKGGLDFVTIRGAGHMVPTYKPSATFAFLKAFLQKSSYPTYQKDCEAPQVL